MRFARFCIICPVCNDRAFILKIFHIRSRFTFNKKERVKSRRAIENLFSRGKSIKLFPLKVLYILEEKQTVALQAGVAVSSKRFKRAVDRNRIKRVLREVYRLQKFAVEALLTEYSMSLSLFVIYTGKEMPLFKDIYDKMGIITTQLTDKIKNQTTRS